MFSKFACLNTSHCYSKFTFRQTPCKSLKGKERIGLYVKELWWFIRPAESHAEGHKGKMRPLNHNRKFLIALGFANLTVKRNPREEVKRCKRGKDIPCRGTEGANRTISKVAVSNRRNHLARGWRAGGEGGDRAGLEVPSYAQHKSVLRVATKEGKTVEACVCHRVCEYILTQL